MTERFAERTMKPWQYRIRRKYEVLYLFIEPYLVYVNQLIINDIYDLLVFPSSSHLHMIFHPVHGSIRCLLVAEVVPTRVR